MLQTKKYQFWFCTGSQDLYGDECLAHVAEHSRVIVESLNESGMLPYEVVWKPTMITSEVIRRTFREANNDENCAGIITWTGKVLDSGASGAEPSDLPSAYAVQPRNPVQ
mgnify:CR=1 FL=1